MNPKSKIQNPKSQMQVLPDMVPVWLETMGWQPDSGHLLEFQALYELILQGNEQLNLTRITEPMEFWEKHLWDSLRGVAQLLQSQMAGQRVIDIGTGAGFPGLPLAIARPDWSVTLLDSTRKKIAFLNTVLDTLGIENVTTLVGRAEEIGQHPQHRQTYDIAAVRALGAANVCAEFALPLLKTGGLAILYRGHWTDEETEALRSPVSQLGGIIETLEGFTTPLTQGVRHCLYLRKVATTPAAFPRPVGVPAHQPLH